MQIHTEQSLDALLLLFIHIPVIDAEFLKWLDALHNAWYAGKLLHPFNHF